MEDVTPRLIADIQAEFERRAKKDPELQKLLDIILKDSRSYTDALDLGDRLGAALSEAFRAGLADGVLPDDKMYFNIADRLVNTVAGGVFDTAAAAAETVQQRINDAAGIGMKAVSSDTRQGRLRDLVNAVSNKTTETARSTLVKATRQLPQGAVSDTMQANAEFQSRAGIEAKIVRKSTGKCCKWCDEVAGKYFYPDVPNDIYRRHDNCKCSVEYDPGKGGKRQTIHSGTEGKRRYVKDKYGDYEMTKEAKAARSKEMAATAKAREDAVREKRIETWKKKKTQGWTPVKEADKIETKISKSGSITTEQAREIIRERIESGAYNLNLSHQQYLKHVEGTPQYKNYAAHRAVKGNVPQSVLYVSEGEAQKYIETLAGTGTPSIIDSVVGNKEFVSCDKIVGKYYERGGWHDTSRAEIIYGQKSSHIVPVKDIG